MSIPLPILWAREIEEVRLRFREQKVSGEGKLLRREGAKETRTFAFKLTGEIVAAFRVGCAIASLYRLDRDPHGACLLRKMDNLTPKKFSRTFDR